MAVPVTITLSTSVPLSCAQAEVVEIATSPIRAVPCSKRAAKQRENDGKFFWIPIFPQISIFFVDWNVAEMRERAFGQCSSKIYFLKSLFGPVTDISYLI
jgi:hypothetical protein